MPAHLNNLPADAKIGWAGRAKISSPADGEIQIENAAGTGATGLGLQSGRLVAATSGAARANPSTQGDFGLHANTTTGVPEFALRGASAVDRLVFDSEVYNPLDYKESTDVSDSECFDRCFRDMDVQQRDDSVGLRDTAYICIIPAGVYEFHETVYLPEESASNLDLDANFRIVGYGALIKSKATYSPGVYLARKKGSGIAVPSISGLTIVGDTDVENMDAVDQFSDGVGHGDRLTYNHNEVQYYPKLKSWTGGDGLQCGISFTNIFYKADTDDCQFYNLGIGLEATNAFGVTWRNLRSFDCFTGIAFRFGSGSYPESAFTTASSLPFCTTNRLIRCDYITTKTNPINGCGFFLQRVDCVHLDCCTISSTGSLKFGVAHPTQGDNVKWTFRARDVTFDIAGNMQAAFGTGIGGDSRLVYYDRPYVKNGTGVLATVWNNLATTASRGTTVSLNFPLVPSAMYSSVPFAAWDNATQYSVGDYVTADLLEANAAGTTHKNIYVCTANPGLPGVNAPHDQFHEEMLGEKSKKYAIGDKVTHNGKIYELVGTPTTFSDVANRTIDTYSERSTGTYTGYLQVTTPAAHNLSVGEYVGLTDGNTQFKGTKLVVEVIDATNFVLDILWKQNIHWIGGVLEDEVGGLYTDKARVSLPPNTKTAVQVGDFITIVSDDVHSYEGTGYEVLYIIDSRNFVIDTPYLGYGVNAWTVPLVGQYFQEAPITNVTSTFGATFRSFRDPLADPDSVWVEDSDAVWLPLCSASLVSLSQAGDYWQAASNVNLGSTYRMSVKANLIGPAKPVSGQHYITPSGAVTPHKLSGISTGGSSAYLVIDEAVNV